MSDSKSGTIITYLFCVPTRHVDADKLQICQLFEAGNAKQLNESVKVAMKNDEKQFAHLDFFACEYTGSQDDQDYQMLQNYIKIVETENTMTLVPPTGEQKFFYMEDEKIIELQQPGSSKKCKVYRCQNLAAHLNHKGVNVVTCRGGHVTLYCN